MVIVIFGDFECPYSKKLNDRLEKIKARYGDTITVYFRHFPLPIHHYAKPAAKAAVCAEEQGKFWPYQDVLFKNQGHLDNHALVQLARNTGLSVATFQRCMTDTATDKWVEDDIRDGHAVGVSSTPTYFINGRRVAGFSYGNEIVEIIEEESGGDRKGSCRR